jgi:hypothetical protein
MGLSRLARQALPQSGNNDITPGGIHHGVRSKSRHGYPTEPVGSIPRPLKLQQAYADYDAKKISKDQLEQEQNAAVVDTLKRFEASIDHAAGLKNKRYGE